MKFKSRMLFWVILLLIPLDLILLNKLNFTAWPEMIAWPYLILKGWLPYRDITIVHNPLLIVDLSLFYKIFGVGILQLKVFTWLLFFIASLLLYLTANEFWGKKIGFLALVFYFLLFVFYDGNGVWFDFYMGIFAFACFYFVKKRSFFWAGVFLALAFLAKQTAIWFLIPLIFEIVRLPLREHPLKVGKMVIGSIVLFALFLAFLLYFRILDDWWNWAVRFGIFVLPRSAGQIQFPSFRQLLFSVFPFLVFIIYCLFPKSRIINHKSNILNLFLWSFAGSLGVYPRFELFHFQPSLFYLAIAFALAFSDFFRLGRRLRFLMVVFLFGNLLLVAGYFVRSFIGGTRFYEADVKEVAGFIKSETISGDYILVLNWWDSLYALTDTFPATKPLVPQLSWYQEVRGVQEEEVKNLSLNKPKFVVLNPYTESGLSSYIPREVYNYVIANYELKRKIGRIEILSPKE